MSLSRTLYPLLSTGFNPGIPVDWEINTQTKQTKNKHKVNVILLLIGVLPLCPLRLNLYT